MKKIIFTIVLTFLVQQSFGMRKLGLKIALRGINSHGEKIHYYADNNKKGLLERLVLWTKDRKTHLNIYYTTHPTLGLLPGPQISANGKTPWDHFLTNPTDTRALFNSSKNELFDAYGEKHNAEMQSDKK